MNVYKYFINFDKEEAWLSDMAKKGYRLIKTGVGYYKFNKVTDYMSEFIFKIDYRAFRNGIDFKDYCAMFEDCGWLHIAGSRYSGSQYFVKTRQDAGEDIFSDQLSRAGRYSRIAYMWMSMAMAYLPIAIMFFTVSRMNNHKIYLTPGLWQMKGLHFYFAFLFETPFAMLRLFGCSIGFILLIIFFLVYAFKSYRLYKKELGK